MTNKEPTKKSQECCETPMERWMAVFCGEYYAEYECFFDTISPSKEALEIISEFEAALAKAKKDPAVDRLVRHLQFVINKSYRHALIVKKRQKRRIEKLHEARSKNAEQDRLIENLLLYEAEMPKGLWEMEKPQD